MTIEVAWTYPTVVTYKPFDIPANVRTTAITKGWEQARSSMVVAPRSPFSIAARLQTIRAKYREVVAAMPQRATVGDPHSLLQELDGGTLTIIEAENLYR